MKKSKISRWLIRFWIITPSILFLACAPKAPSVTICEPMPWEPISIENGPWENKVTRLPPFIGPQKYTWFTKRRRLVFRCAEHVPAWGSRKKALHGALVPSNHRANHLFQAFIGYPTNPSPELTAKFSMYWKCHSSIVSRIWTLEFSWTPSKVENLVQTCFPSWTRCSLCCKVTTTTFGPRCRRRMRTMNRLMSIVNSSHSVKTTSRRFVTFSACHFFSRHP